jgi:hypothetical protein
MSDPKTEMPLESHSARGMGYARVGIVIALVPVLLAALLETWAFFVDRAVSSLSSGHIGFIGTLGLVAGGLAAWALFRLRTYPLWKLIALSGAAMVLAGIGWVYLIASAH